VRDSRAQSHAFNNYPTFVSTVFANSTATIPMSAGCSKGFGSISPSAASLAACSQLRADQRSPAGLWPSASSAAMVSMTAQFQPLDQVQPDCFCGETLQAVLHKHTASTVAVVVPSPATSLVCFETSRSTLAPIFSNGHSSSIRWRCRRHHATRSRAIGRSMIAFMAFGPSVPRTALASWRRPCPRRPRGFIMQHDFRHWMSSPFY